MTLSLLNVARTALWNSIDNWSELRRHPDDTQATVFNQVYRFDAEPPLLDEVAPCLSDLPALAIMPAQVVPAWWTNEMQHWPVLYELTLWTQDWQLPEAEDLIEKVINAIYRCRHPDGNYSYVKAPPSAMPPGTGYFPQRIGPITFRRAQVGVPGDARLKVIVTTAAIALRTQKDPFQ